jgi:hypothetical protein
LKERQLQFAEDLAAYQWRGMMGQLGRLLLLPLTVAGAVIGLLYAVLTGRHPSPRLLMVFGVFGLGLVAAVIILTVTGRIAPRG